MSSYVHPVGERRWQLRQVMVVEGDVAGAFDQPDDRLGRGRTPYPVAPEQADDLARLHVEVDPVQHMALAVIRLQIADVQHYAASACWPR
jgi:hypothetical protein